MKYTDRLKVSLLVVALFVLNNYFFFLMGFKGEQPPIFLKVFFCISMSVLFSMIESLALLGLYKWWQWLKGKEE